MTTAEDIRPPRHREGPNPTHVEADKKESTAANLERQITLYKQVEEAGDGRTAEAEAQRVAEAMRHVGDQHDDEEMRNHWHQKAEDFLRGGANERANILGGIGKGLLIIVAAPFALAAAGVFTAGAVIYGVGTLVKGIGTVMTGGLLKKGRRRGSGGR